MWYATRGYAFFDAGNFAESGAVAHRRMMAGFVGFVLCVALTAGAVVLVAPPS
jgi:hypothetical protein